MPWRGISTPGAIWIVGIPLRGEPDFADTVIRNRAEASATVIIVCTGCEGDDVSRLS